MKNCIYFFLNVEYEEKYTLHVLCIYNIYRVKVIFVSNKLHEYTMLFLNSTELLKYTQNNEGNHVAYLIAVPYLTQLGRIKTAAKNRGFCLYNNLLLLPQFANYISQESQVAVQFSFSFHFTCLSKIQVHITQC